MPPFPSIETSRLRLRELGPDDAQALLAIHGNAQAMRYFGTDPLRELSEAQSLIERFASWRAAPNPGVRWGIEEKASGALVGTCGLFAWNREWRKCATGYELDVDHRGKGLMHEALCAAFAWGFAEMQLNRIEAQIHPENSASLRLAERLGFCREGLLREVARWGGQFHDLHQLSLLREDWHARSGGLKPRPTTANMASPSQPTSPLNAEHYVWGEVCDGWHLLKEPDLSVIQERVPPGAGEARHFHAVSRQFFFVISGTATLELPDGSVTFRAGQGLHVPPGVAHRFVNSAEDDVRFLVISAPTTHGDRTHVQP